MSHIVEKLLQYVEDMKDNNTCSDNDYLTACNVLKNSYEIIKLKQNVEITNIKDLNIKVYAKKSDDTDWCEFLHIKHKYKENDELKISFELCEQEKTVKLFEVKTTLDFILSTNILSFDEYRVVFNNLYCIYKFEDYFQRMEQTHYDDYTECCLETRDEILTLWKDYLVKIITKLILI